ncbi:ATP-binding protein [Permianibacter aggregans]|uniref:Cdc6-like AAA superfamily ATPase n=1 Tax=Permianibacter aggregans TaxID=1510150 RepID=A0A4V3D6J5_9GAMM|nr:ATP-binding protein [Permianibacter aggregans]QGX40290.1 AAA family ATPase [Permianibacter aggregans]TDQ44207.1 hypothetical protein EV696_12518 [Permianibacter aggregans]
MDWLKRRLEPLRQWLPFLPAVNQVAEIQSGMVRPAELQWHLAEQLEALPERLQQALQVEPLAAGDSRFVGREKAIEQLQKSLDDWQRERPSLTAIIAPNGAGMTSLINQVRGSLPSQQKSYYLSLAQRFLETDDVMALFNSLFKLPRAAENIDDLIVLVNDQPRAIVFIDDGHMLLARRMGAKTALEAFMAVLVASQKQHCWIIACANQAWRRLVFTHQLDRYMQRQIELDYLSESEFVEAIEQRLPDGQFPWAERENKKEDEDDPLPDMLKPIYKLCSGQIELGLFFLADALSVNDKQQLCLEKLAVLDVNGLGGSDVEEQFTLAEIFLHGGLTELEHRHMFRLSREQSLLRLDRLHRLGVLTLSRTPGAETSNRYRLNPLLTQATVKQLEHSNRLY